MVIDVPGYEPTVVKPGVEVVFFSGGALVLAVADPERPGFVPEPGPVERLAEPTP